MITLINGRSSTKDRQRRSFKLISVRSLCRPSLDDALVCICTLCSLVMHTFHTSEFLLFKYRIPRKIPMFQKKEHHDSYFECNECTDIEKEKRFVVNRWNQMYTTKCCHFLNYFLKLTYIEPTTRWGKRKKEKERKKMELNITIFKYISFQKIIIRKSNWWDE